jgi:hypothetical protein
MRFRLFEMVVLERDLPQHRLRRGDIGTIVELYEPDGIEVEFLGPAGDTRAVVTLSIDDTRPAGDDDLARRSRRELQPV